VLREEDKLRRHIQAIKRDECGPFRGAAFGIVETERNGEGGLVRDRTAGNGFLVGVLAV